MQSTFQDRLVGVWSLLDYRTETSSDEPPNFPLGPQAKGFIFYTRDGFMSAHLMRPGARPYTNWDLHDGLDKELSDAMRCHLAYSGRYTISSPSSPDSSHAVIRHHVSTSSIPNWVGTVQERGAHLDGDRLVLHTRNMVQIQGRSCRVTLTWERAGGQKSRL